MLGGLCKPFRFIYNSSECDDDTFAFVFPSNADGVPAPRPET